MVREATNNPFEPGSDRIPRVWAGRQEQLADWRDRLRPRRVAGQGERGRTLLGEPGIGKSVLVRRMATDAARSGDWVTPQIRVPGGVNPLPLLAGALLDLADTAGLAAKREKRLGALLRRVREVSLMGAGLTLAAPDGGIPPHEALSQLLVEIGRAARVAKVAVVVHVDEVQNVDEGPLLSQLLVALGDALAHDDHIDVPGGQLDAALPLIVFLTGLPEFHDQASTRTGATFARRFATTLLAPISDDDLHDALRPLIQHGWPVPDGAGSVTAVTMTPDAADAIVGRCFGDPFLFQLAGQHAWDAGSSDQITVADVENGWRRAAYEARQHVERILERVPPKERHLLDAMAGLDPAERTATTIAQAMGYGDASHIGPTAQRLDTIRGIITRGSPYSFRARTVEAYLTSNWPG